MMKHIYRDGSTTPPKNIYRCVDGQPVKVRKYQVDIKGLQELLRNHKNMSNKQISNELNVKKTTVDHWFRIDNCFSIYSLIKS